MSSRVSALSYIRRSVSNVDRMDLEIKFCVGLSARGVDGGADHSQTERSARILVELSKEVFVGFDGFALHGDDHVARANTRLLCGRRGHHLIANTYTYS